MTTLGRILVVEDDPNDVELTLIALGEYILANEVVVTRDGQQALDRRKASQWLTLRNDSRVSE